MNEYTVCILHAVLGFLSSLLHDAVKWDSCMRSVTNELVRNTGGIILTGNSKYLKKKLSQCRFIHHKHPPQLRWDRTRESAMKGRRLTASEMSQPYICSTSRRSLSYISPLIFPTARLKFVKVVWQISFANYQPAKTIMDTWQAQPLRIKVTWEYYFLHFKLYF